MKNNISFFTIFLAALTAVVSCSKDNQVLKGTEEKEGITAPSTIHVTIPENLTKVSLTQDAENPDGEVKLAWEEGDKIYVANHEDNTTWVEYQIVTPLDENPHIAEFTIKEGETPITATSFDILYGAENLSSAVGIDLSTQTQTGNANMGHLKYMSILSGVNTIEDLQFSSEWAEDKGGEFKETGILRMRLQLPTTITSISSVVLAAPSKVFYANNGLGNEEKTDMIRIDFSESVDISEDNNIATVYATLPWGDIELDAKTELTAVAVTSDNYPYYYSKVFSSSSAITFATGKVNAVKLNRTGFSLYAGGDGTESSPWQISSKWHMMNTKPSTEANSGNISYFKLLSDIDLSGLFWIPLNNVASSGLYNKYINFDGQEHTISNLTTNPSSIPDYPSLFGVLQGSVKDLTIDNATITPGGKKSGVLAGYIGTGTDYNGEKSITNVHVKNSYVGTSTNPGSFYCGGFAAHANRAGYTIRECSVENTSVYSTRLAAGFITYFQQSSIISDITVDNTDVFCTGHNRSDGQDGCAGGITAWVAAAVCFDKCSYSNSTVTGAECNGNSDNSKKDRYVGGLAAFVADVGATFDDCNVNNVQLALSGEGTDSNYRYVGGAFGWINSAVKVGDNTGCTVTDISTEHVKNYVGGFVGYNNGGSIKNSSSSGTISGGASVGGFAGYINGGTMNQNYSTCNVSGTSANIGGFVGQVSGGTFEYCNASGNITSSTDNSGGFVGYEHDNSVFNACTAKGSVSSSGCNVGGFVGQSGGNSTYTNNRYWGESVQSTYDSSSEVNVGGFCGGILYAFTGSFEYCWVSRGASTMTIKSTKNKPRVGGFIGSAGINTANSNTGTIKSCRVHRSNITGGQYTGGFAGVSYVTIIASAVTPATSSNNFKVTANGNQSGGFVGYQQNNSITHCYSLYSVTGGNKSDIGGFAGRIVSTSIEYCYSYGEATSSGSNNASLIGYVKSASTVQYCIAKQDKVIFGYGSNLVTGASNNSNNISTIHTQASTYEWGSKLVDNVTVWNISSNPPKHSSSSFSEKEPLAKDDPSKWPSI